jgi:hypothetical protein
VWRLPWGGANTTEKNRAKEQKDTTTGEYPHCLPRISADTVTTLFLLAALLVGSGLFVEFHPPSPPTSAFIRPKDLEKNRENKMTRI